MEFFLSMSVFSSAADISREKGKAKEWIRAWVAKEDRKSAGAEQGKPPQQQQQQEQSRGEQQKKLQGRPWFAPEFDGINCFETIVSH